MQESPFAVPRIDEEVLPDKLLVTSAINAMLLSNFGGDVPSRHIFCLLKATISKSPFARTTRMSRPLKCKNRASQAALKEW